MKVTLKHVGNSGTYDSDVYEHIDWVYPMTDATVSLGSSSGRGLYYSPHAVRVVLMEPDDVKE